MFLNDERLKIKNFKQYVELYVSSALATAAENAGAAQAKPIIIHEQIGPRWEVAFTVSDRQFGTRYTCHCHLSRRSNIHLKASLLLFRRTRLRRLLKLMEIPTFDSQTKDTLTLHLPASKFGSKPSVTVLKSSIVDNVLKSCDLDIQPRSTVRPFYPSSQTPTRSFLALSIKQ